MTKLDDHPYVIREQVITPEMCDLISDYARLKARVKPNVKKGKDPLAGIHREYGDLLIETLLERLKPIVEEATNKQLWPTLSFYYTYQYGNQLVPHTDRDSCEYVAGLCLGADPLFKQHHTSWPLNLKVHGQTQPVVLNPGDMLIFRGNATQHWREPFQGSWFVSAILGYVDQNGPNAHQKYDQRQSIGRPHVGMFTWLFKHLYARLRNRLRSK